MKSLPNHIHNYLTYIGYSKLSDKVYARTQAHTTNIMKYEYLPDRNILLHTVETGNGKRSEAIDIPSLSKRLERYIHNGYSCRKEYIDSLCEDYPEDTVKTLAGLLGPSEDFDGLVSELQDFEQMGGF